METAILYGVGKIMRFGYLAESIPKAWLLPNITGTQRELVFDLMG